MPGEITSFNEKKVFESLSNPKYDFRTISGISKETGLFQSEVREILDKYPKLIRKSLVRNREGDELFTIRSRPIKIRERLAELRMFLAMPFD